tara:strand:+ start:1868 stop:2023 length:156 start_codon:yes stop_codon:yes gene_type:complete
MEKKIHKSIQYLFSEYKRLKIKDDKKTISKNEKDILIKLSHFLGKDKLKKK